MKEVYLPTKDETRDFKNSPLLKDFKNSPLLNDLLSKPASLKNLCRNSLRKSMRILTGGRTIKPLVAKLENLNVITWNGQKMPLPKTLGNFLLCDPPINWRKDMVIKKKIRLFVCQYLCTRLPTRWRLCCIPAIRRLTPPSLQRRRTKRIPVTVLKKQHWRNKMANRYWEIVIHYVQYK